VAEKNRQRRVLLLDSDTLGLAAGLLVAAVVAGLGTWRGLDTLAVAVRAGWTFLGTYAVVFLLVRTILRVTVREMVERRREQEAVARAAAQSEEAPAEGTPPEHEEDTGGS